VSGYQLFESGDYPAPNDFLQEVHISCPSGSSAVGGGVRINDGSGVATANVTVQMSDILPDGSGWQVILANTSGQTVPMNVSVTCITSPGAKAATVTSAAPATKVSRQPISS
jgi:hypothetical protein